MNIVTYFDYNYISAYTKWAPHRKWHHYHANN